MAGDSAAAGGQVRPSRFLVWTGRLAFFTGLLAVVLAVASPLGYRQDVLELGQAFTGLLAGLAFAAVAVIMLLITILAALFLRPRPGPGLALLGGIFGGGLIAVALPALLAVQSVPPIHDITTDTENPPQFLALLAQRSQDGAMNPPEYLNDDGTLAAQQRAAYPDVRPLLIPNGTIGAVLDQAQQVARELGWTIITQARPSNGAPPRIGRLEATETSFWFGFTDDIVVRVTELPEGGVQVDIRSKSRVGISDLGANAARITAFLTRLEALNGQ